MLADAAGPVRLLLVEDDRPLAELLADYLRASGFAAEFDLLWLLTAHAGQALPRRVILERLRGTGGDGGARSVLR